MAGSGWLYKSSSTHLQALNTDWWWHFTKSSREEKRQQLKVFSIYANSGCQCASGCFVNNDEPIWWFHTLVRHMEVTLLSVATVCLVWLGVTIGLLCVNAHMCENMCVVFVCLFFFFLWQHIAWFLGTVHCPHGACHLTNGLCVCHGEADQTGARGLEGREGSDENVTEGEGVGREREKQRRCHASLRRYLLSSVWCYLNPGSLYQPPWLADQEWKIWALAKLNSMASRVYTLISMREQVAQYGYLYHLSLSWFHEDFKERFDFFFFFLTTIIQSVSCSHFSCMLCKCVVDCITNNANQCCLFSISATKCSCFINSISPVCKP